MSTDETISQKRIKNLVGCALKAKPDLTARFDEVPISFIIQVVFIGAKTF
jgi:hypothetical protein